ncbi:carbohydrate ABC transporter permease [Paenibacillus validus]|uniref:ABC transporter permease subunit n=1 Tax=Paenibacillus validus TaxID=44253 RepID=A0A7X3CTR5_9BACL|nr:MULTISPECIES: carbohydrate ABC transporter permease [Paenibacillus]MED4601283.1 carbohydrate ABC transporter permease [Paenibacillus validus]MED4605946.1 carbohydrate ABC transporter permease [Paenibacillus validus]MUG71319.1 ABC transporter permease subunit [Paenibacillus validus]
MKRAKALYTLLGALIGLIHIVPFYVLITTSFKEELDTSSKWVMPGYLFWDNFTNAWQLAGLDRAFVNTVIVTVLSIVLILILGSSAAFPLARHRSALNKWMYGFFVSALIVPPLTILVPLYKMFVDIGAMNTYTGIVILHVTFHLSMAIFLFTGFISTIPRELDEAAMIDGASRLGLFFRIILPVLMPITATVIIMNGVSIWNDYQFSVFFLQKLEYRTITVALSAFFGENNSDIGWVAAGSLLAALPSILLYLFLQKYFVEGMTSGAVKG